MDNPFRRRERPLFGSRKRALFEYHLGHLKGSPDHPRDCSDPWCTVESQRLWPDPPGVVRGRGIAPKNPPPPAVAPPTLTAPWAVPATRQTLRQALWDVFVILGGDTDGDKGPHATSDQYLIDMTLDLAKETRAAYDFVLGDDMSLGGE